MNNTKQMLLKRESWKYSDIMLFLDSLKIDYEFEFILNEHFIYDLCLKDKRIIIEFDGSSHNSRIASIDDFEKDTVAEENGYEVIRIKVQDNTVIPYESIEDIVRGN